MSKLLSYINNKNGQQNKANADLHVFLYLNQAELNPFMVFTSWIFLAESEAVKLIKVILVLELLVKSGFI